MGGRVIGMAARRNHKFTKNELEKITAKELVFILIDEKLSMFTDHLTPVPDRLLDLKSYVNQNMNNDPLPKRFDDDTGLAGRSYLPIGTPIQVIKDRIKGLKGAVGVLTHQNGSFGRGDVGILIKSDDDYIDHYNLFLDEFRVLND